MKESDLYLPLKRFLESQNYEVKGEVQDCDVLAVRDKEAPVVVELKLSLNLDVILQAVDRLSVTSKVYIGIPKHCKILSRRRKHIIKLLKMLALGLVVIDPDVESGDVKVLLDPGEYRPRKSKYRQERLLGEFIRQLYRLQRYKAGTFESLIGCFVKKITFDAIVFDTTVKYNQIAITIFMERKTEGGHIIEVALEGAVSMRNTEEIE